MDPVIAPQITQRKLHEVSRQYQPLMAAAHRAVLRTGQILVEKQTRGTLSVDAEMQAFIVAEMEKAAQASGLRNIAFLAEEGELGKKPEVEFDVLVVIDPVDGTGKFNLGGRFFATCVTICFADRRNGVILHPLQGLTYAPRFHLERFPGPGTLFEANLLPKLGPAMINNKLVAVPADLSLPSDLRAMRHFSARYNLEERDDLGQIYELIARLFYPHVQDKNRLLGADVLFMCGTLLSEFDLDLHLKPPSKIFDVLSAIFWVKQAGGMVITPQGQPFLPIDFEVMTFQPHPTKPWKIGPVLPEASICGPKPVVELVERELVRPC